MKNKELKNLLPGIKENILLAQHNTFKIGGRAQYFYTAKSKEEILRALQTVKKLNIPYFILGEGSNLLMSDRGFKGLVIKIENRKYKIENSYLYAEAGISFPVLVKETGKLGLSGLEWAGGLPGTLGGAVRGNAGAFGGEIKDNISKVWAIDRQGKTKIFSKKECDFSYRSSIFKKNNFIVLAAEIKMKKGNKNKIEAIARDHTQYRQDRHPLEYPNSGSIFKNCDLNLFPQKEHKNFSHVVKNDPFPIVPTAYIISESELKGLRVGGAEVSKKHPNYIVNIGGALASDVMKLIHLVKQKVKRKFGIEIEEEIQFVGF